MVVTAQREHWSFGPTGPAGSNGSNGSAGATGPSGATGAAGATGPTGPAGSAGSAGSAGATGPSGATGAAGATGPTGPAGSNGSNGGDGAAGATGPSGATGAAGATGPTGPAGSNGSRWKLQATGPAGAAASFGSNGSRWCNLGQLDPQEATVATVVMALREPLGLREQQEPLVRLGLLDPLGSAGSAGAAGPSGATGAAGATGPTGPAGSNGSNGSNGSAGATGPTGPAGSDGTGAVTAINNATANELVTIGATTTELDAEANLTFDGSKLTLAGNLHTSVHDYGGGSDTNDVNIDLDEDALQKADFGSGNANVDTAVANKGAGKSVLIKFTAHTSDNTFVWNSSWIFIGEKPASIAANKTALLSITCFGTNETDVICSYAVQD